MRDERNSALVSFFTIDSNSGNYMIDVNVQEINEMFRHWDNSPYQIKNLNPDLKNYLLEYANEIDLKNPITLRFHISKPLRDLKTEKMLENGIRNDFYHSLFKLEKEMKQRKRKTGIYVLLALFFIFVSIYLQAVEGRNILGEILLYSLTIGSWVFLWEVFSVFFQYSEILRNKKQLYRLYRSEILFRYKN